MENVIFSLVKNKIEKVKSKQFIYNGLVLHIRKDYVYLGDKRKKFIITENTSGAMFAWHNTKKEALIYMDILFYCYRDSLDKVINNVKIKQFDLIIKEYQYGKSN